MLSTRLWMYLVHMVNTKVKSASQFKFLNPIENKHPFQCVIESNKGSSNSKTNNMKFNWME